MFALALVRPAELGLRLKHAGHSVPGCRAPARCDPHFGNVSTAISKSVNQEKNNETTNTNMFFVVDLPLPAAAPSHVRVRKSEDSIPASACPALANGRIPGLDGIIFCCGES